MSRRSPLPFGAEALARGLSGGTGAAGSGIQAFGQGLGQAGQQYAAQKRLDDETEWEKSERKRLEEKGDAERARLEGKGDAEALRVRRARAAAAAAPSEFTKFDEGQEQPAKSLSEQEKKSLLAHMRGTEVGDSSQGQDFAAHLRQRFGVDEIDAQTVAGETISGRDAARAAAAAEAAKVEGERKFKLERDDVQGERKLYQDESKWGRDIAKIYIEDALKRARETGNKPLESQYGEGVKRYHAWQSADQRAAGDAIMSNAAPEFAREMREAEFGKAIAGIAQHPTMAPEVKRDLLRMFAEGARGAGASASSVREEMIQSALGLADQMGGGGGGGGGDGSDASAAPPPREAVRSIADTLRGRGIDLNDDDIERISDIESLVESGDISDDDARSEVELLIRDARQRVPGATSPPTMDAAGMPTSAGVPDAPVGPMVDDPDGGVLDTPGGVADEANALDDVMRARSEPAPAGDITGYIPAPMREFLMSFPGSPSTQSEVPQGMQDALMTLAGEEGPPAPPISKRLAHLFRQEGFRVTSTVRDKGSNAKAKGIDKSRHLLRNGGDAIDIGVDDNTTNSADRFPELVEKYRAIMSNPKLRPRVRFIQLEMPVEFEGQLNVPPDVKVEFVKERSPHIHIEGDFEER